MYVDIPTDLIVNLRGLITYLKNYSENRFPQALEELRFSPFFIIFSLLPLLNIFF
jgi:hypothetical protein